MRKLATYTLTLGLMAGLATAALAQPGQGGGRRPGGAGGPGGGMGGMVGRGGQAILLANEGVQEELKLSDEQKEKVKDAAKKAQEKIREQMEKLRDMDDAERREKAPELMKKATEESTKLINELLKPEQQKRLKQIELQNGGVMVFATEEVQKQLKLTDDQKEKVKAVGEEFRKDQQELMQEARNGGGNGFQALMPKIQKLGKEAKDNVVKLLTDEQQSAWKEMTGAPFEVKMQPGMGQRGGRGEGKGGDGKGGDGKGKGRPARPNNDT